MKTRDQTVRDFKRWYIVHLPDRIVGAWEFAFFTSAEKEIVLNAPVYRKEVDAQNMVHLYGY